MSFVPGAAGAAASFPAGVVGGLTANLRTSEGNGTTTLVAGTDNPSQVFNLTNTRSCVLPSTGVNAGDVWVIENRGAFDLTLKSSDTTAMTNLNTANLIDPTCNNNRTVMRALQATPTAPSHWMVVDVRVVSDIWQTHTTASFGSTATKIRRFSTQQVSVGTAITYADSATAGGTFTINEAGLYIATFIDQNGGSSVMVGISRNTAQTTTNIDSLSTVSERLGYTVGVAGQSGSCTVVARLAVGDVIRAHGDASATTKASFRITQLSR